MTIIRAILLFLMLQVPVVSSAVQITVREECSFEKNYSYVLLLVDLKYKTGEVYSRLVQLSCNLLGCSGFVVNNNDKYPGGATSFTDLKVKHRGDSLVVLQNGLSVYEINRADRSFRWTEDTDGGGVAQRKCPN